MVADQCVGVTDDSYIFHEAYRAVQEKIAKENERVDGIVSDPDAPRKRAVTVALLHPMTVVDTSAFTVEEVRNTLEGAYTAQHRVNHTAAAGDPDPLIRLVLANEGSHQEQWRPVVKQLVDMKDDDAPLVAVAGLGVSINLTEQAAKELSDHGIPTVGAVTTAEQLNYQNIEGFVRVSPSNRQYVESLKAYFDQQQKPDSAVLVYDSNSGSRGDIFVDSLRDELTSQMQELIEPPAQSFVGKYRPARSDPTLFQGITNYICSKTPVLKGGVLRRPEDRPARLSE